MWAFAFIRSWNQVSNSCTWRATLVLASFKRSKSAAGELQFEEVYKGYECQFAAFWLANAAPWTLLFSSLASFLFLFTPGCISGVNKEVCRPLLTNDSEGIKGMLSASNARNMSMISEVSWVLCFPRWSTAMLEEWALKKKGLIAVCRKRMGLMDKSVEHWRTRWGIHVSGCEIDDKKVCRTNY